MVDFITKDMLLGDIVEKYPEAAEIMLAYGLHCVGCALNQFDTVEAGCRMHGMCDADIDAMVQKINEAIHDS